MHRKYNLKSFLTQTTIWLLAINFVTANLLERLAEMTLMESNPGDLNRKILKKEIADATSTEYFFQDIFSERLTPFKIEFGHVCEDPIEWEQRFERKEFDSNRHIGKLKWGNQRGEYGEHYWDLNH